jgi:hypothetical protein
MFDRILTGLIGLCLLFFLFEWRVPGHSELAVLEEIRVESGYGARKTNANSETVAYFKGYRVRISDSDIGAFHEGDSIRVLLTPVLKKVNTLKQLSTGYESTARWVFSAGIVIVLMVVAQSVSVFVSLPKHAKDFIQLFTCCLLLVSVYALVF